jgi:hypothetical protein
MSHHLLALVLPKGGISLPNILMEAKHNPDLHRCFILVLR